MARPKSKYNIGYCPPYDCFRPSSSVDCECIDITQEEIESLRLKNIKNFDQTKAAEKLGVSQSTFQRILQSAYKKVSEALIDGKELRIIK